MLAVLVTTSDEKDLVTSGLHKNARAVTTHRRHALDLRVALHDVEVEDGIVGVRLGGEAQHLDPVLAAVVEQQAHRGDDAVQPGLG